MDKKTAIEKLFHTYQELQQGPAQLGDFLIKYPTKQGIGFLYIIISPPKKRHKGKKKDLDKALNKSAKANRPILPKDFDDIQDFLWQNFKQIAKPKAEVLAQFETFIAGLRLEFIPSHNLKYIFNDPRDAELFVFAESKHNEVVAYLNVVGAQEDGLSLAHEGQIDFIKEALHRGTSPNALTSLPALRTGDTEIDFNAAQASSGKQEREESDQVAKFREYIKQKQLQGEIDEEMAFETVIDFSNKGRASIIEAQKKAGPASPLRGNKGSEAIASPRPAPAPAPSPQSEIKSNYGGESPKAGQGLEISYPGQNPVPTVSPEGTFGAPPNKLDDQTKMVGDRGPSASEPQPDSDLPQPSEFIGIPKPAPLSKESVVSSESTEGTVYGSTPRPDNITPVMGYEKPPPISIPPNTGSAPPEQSTSNILDKKGLLEEQLKDLTIEFTKQMAHKDQLIATLKAEVDELQETKANLEAKLAQAEAENRQKIQRIKAKFTKIQAQLQPILEENQRLKQKVAERENSSPVDEGIELINQNLQLQEKLEAATQNLKDMALDSLKESQEFIAQQKRKRDGQDSGQS